MPGPQILRHLNGPGDIYSRGAAKTQTFILNEAEKDVERFLIRTAISAIHFNTFKIGCDATLSDAFSD